MTWSLGMTSSTAFGSDAASAASAMAGAVLRAHGSKINRASLTSIGVKLLLDQIGMRGIGDDDRR